MQAREAKSIGPVTAVTREEQRVAARRRAIGSARRPYRSWRVKRAPGWGRYDRRWSRWLAVLW